RSPDTATPESGRAAVRVHAPPHAPPPAPRIDRRASRAPEPDFARADRSSKLLARRLFRILGLAVPRASAPLRSACAPRRIKLLRRRGTRSNYVPSAPRYGRICSGFSRAFRLPTGCRSAAAQATQGSVDILGQVNYIFWFHMLPGAQRGAGT